MVPSCLLLAALLLAQDGTVCTPRVLDDAALERVTAGSADAVARAGGNVAAQSGRVRQQSNATVDVRGSAQREVRALNIVNGADSLTAAGANVIVGTASMSGGADVRQQNVVWQQAPRSAQIEAWRGEGAEAVTLFEWRSSSLEGYVDGMVLDPVQTATGVARGSDPGGETSIVIGSGFAAAGALDAHFGGGGVDVTFELDARFVVTGESCFLWWCSSDTTVTRGHATVTASAAVPAVSLQRAEGVACAVVLSNCGASGSAASDTRRESTHAIPAALSGARGESLAVGGASVDAEHVAAVTIAGDAQQALRGLNVMNVAGSAIANGVNVTGGALTGSLLRAAQQNVIVQTR